MPAKKRAKVMTASQSIREKLPCLTGLSDDIDSETGNKVMDLYFNTNTRPNRFKYVSIMKLSGHEPYNAIHLLNHAGAFATHSGREALIELIQDARNAGMHRGECTDKTLDALERCANCLFSLEQDGFTIGCGKVEAVDFPARLMCAEICAEVCGNVM